MMRNCLLLASGFLAGGLFAMAMWFKLQKGHDDYVASNANITFARRIFGDVKKEFGSAKGLDPLDATNIVGSIHLTKDMDLAVYMTNGVKTVRAYE